MIDEKYSRIFYTFYYERRNCKLDYKKVAVGVGIAYVSYKVGKLVGVVKSYKMFIDGMEEEFPGAKEYVCKEMSNKVITKIFNKTSEGEEES